MTFPFHSAHTPGSVQPSIQAQPSSQQHRVLQQLQPGDLRLQQLQQQQHQQHHHHQQLQAVQQQHINAQQLQYLQVHPHIIVELIL